MIRERIKVIVFYFNQDLEEINWTVCFDDFEHSQIKFLRKYGDKILASSKEEQKAESEVVNY